MAHAVYILCSLTCLVCTALLAKAYRLTKISLLFWSAIAFLAFTVTNVLLFIDLVLVPDIDLEIFRQLTTLAGVVLLLYGLIHEQT